MWQTGTGVGSSPAAATSNIYDPVTNRKTNESYDKAGNQTSMGGMYSFSYDAENRQVSETNTLGNPAAQYIYDGSGQRVEKMVGGTTTVYAYDAFGQLAAEYSSPVVATPCQPCYLIPDHLGSTRLVLDQSAQVVSFHDYLPFGEEVPGNSVGRGPVFGGADGVNQKFTGEYRDTETGNDFFGARYYGGGMGRFLSPDPANAGAELMHPQTWNAYAYVGNNPLTLVDPSGLCAEGDSSCFSVTKTERGCAWWQFWCWGGGSAPIDPISGFAPYYPNCQYDVVCFGGGYQNSGSSGGRGGGGTPAPHNSQPPKTGNAPSIPLFTPLDILRSLIPPLDPQVCSGGGFVYAGGGVKIPGTGIHAGLYLLPVDFQSGQGFSSGVLAEAEIPHTPIAVGGEYSWNWKTGKGSGAALGFASKDAGGMKLGAISVGALADSNGDVGAYAGGAAVGGGGYFHLSLFGCH